MKANRTDGLLPGLPSGLVVAHVMVVTGVVEAGAVWS